MAHRERNLTPEALALLLERLDPDPQRAEQEYLKLWRRAATFMRQRGCPDEEDLASEVVLRVVEKLAQGEIHDLKGFVVGVGLRVAKEVYRDRVREEPIEGDIAEARIRNDPDNEQEAAQALEHALVRLDECLERLSREDRELILEYYQHEHRARIEGRKRLAKRLGISEGELRVKAFRIRQKLKEYFNQEHETDSSFRHIIVEESCGRRQEPRQAADSLPAGPAVRRRAGPSGGALLR